MDTLDCSLVGIHIRFYFFVCKCNHPTSFNRAVDLFIFYKRYSVYLSYFVQIQYFSLFILLCPNTIFKGWAILQLPGFLSIIYEQIKKLYLIWHTQHSTNTLTNWTSNGRDEGADGLEAAFATNTMQPDASLKHIKMMVRHEVNAQLEQKQREFENKMMDTIGSLKLFIRDEISLQFNKDTKEHIK